MASEAAYHLLGGVNSQFKPCHVKHENETHWFLRHKTTNEIIDMTAGQFRTTVPYDLGRGCGFLTKQPSKRAQILIERLLR